MSAVYQMPEVSLGDWVYFYGHEGSDPSLGVVQKVGQGTVVLWVLSPGYGGSDRPSVHHIDDPRLLDHAEWKRYGTWQHKPRDPRIAILSERVAALEKRIEKGK